jgi:hypothetical protein
MPTLTGIDMTEPVPVTIAAASAGKTANSLYDPVKQKFAGRSRAAAALDAAEGTSGDSAEVHALSEELAAAERDDPVFAIALRAVWLETCVEQRAGDCAVVNYISGTVA